MRRAYIISGCIALLSFFIGCGEQSENEGSSDDPGKKELHMKETSELAALMRKMQQENLDMRRQILRGELPQEFSEEFLKIHTAASTPGMKEDTAVFNAMATEYIRNVKVLTDSKDTTEAKIAYNNMIMTCASCHQMYCQGPLAAIRKMKIPADG